MKPLYKKNDVVYCALNGSILPIIIDDIIENNNSYYYKINHEKYLEFMQSAILVGMGDKVPVINKNEFVIQEDLFNSMEALDIVSTGIHEVNSILKTTQDIGE